MVFCLKTYPLFSPNSFSPKTYQYPQRAIEEKVATHFERILQSMKAWNEPIATTMTSMKWLALIPSAKLFGESALECLDELKKPFFLASFILDFVVVKKLLQGKVVCDPVTFIRFLSLLGTRACKTIRWLEKFQWVQLSAGALWQLKFAIYVTTLVRNVIKLGESVYNQESPSEVLRLTLKLAATSIAIYSVIYATSALYMAKLICTTGAIALTYLY